MKKKIFAIALSAVLLSSCIGSFKAFNGVLNWNEGVSGNKFVNELVFAGLWIIPVYEIALTGDALILNTVEFWTGSNPMSMKDGEMKEQVFASNGREFKMVLTKNHIKIQPLDGAKSTELVYLPADASWNLDTSEGLVKLAQLQNERVNGKQMIKMFYSEDQTALVDVESVKLRN